jgi:hypothetical protein
MAASWIVAIAAVAAVGLSTYEYASAPGAPKPPNAAAATRAGIEAEAATLADRRRLEAAAQQGGATTYETAAHKEKVDQQFVHVPTGEKNRAGFPISKLVPYVASEWDQGGKYYQAGQSPPDIITKKVTVKFPKGTKTADFTGYGEADVQGKVARQQADNMLALEKKFGPQYIEEALKEQQLADPEGTAARSKLYDLIKQQEDAKPDRPVAELLDKQVAEQLAAGKNLDGVSEEVLKEAVRQAQASRGQAPDGSTRFDQPLTEGFAGEDRLSDAQRKALGWLTSGATPEDVGYRREQQNISNLGAFVNNQTPESQFQTLSGAQQGPAPFVPGKPLPGQAPGVGPAANSAAISGWGTDLAAQQSQANPWIAGLSALLHGASAAGNAGYKPLATSV